MHHGGRPEVAAWLGLSDVAVAWNAIAFDGVAAVIVFFVISGLCVHYPYARGEPFDLPAYLARRYIRIGIPLLAVECFIKLSAPLVGDDIAAASVVVLWSLWCEMIYYALYPVLLTGFRRIGLAPIIIVAFVAASLMILGHWSYMLYPSFPRRWAWLTALPAWLLGCAIAQIIAAERLPMLPGPIWSWRIAAVLLSIPPKALVYVSISPILIGNPATLDLFAVFVFFWLMKEIATFDRDPPPAVLEWCGCWSYSLYLVHRTVIVAFVHFTRPINPLERWALQLAAILVVSYGFYCIVEHPAHMIAGSLGRRLGKRGTPAIFAMTRLPFRLKAGRSVAER
jgi:peptidoglycan/LPS O-acetylase OafA/YrhL